jgi:hypothetical protein
MVSEDLGRSALFASGAEVNAALYPNALREDVTGNEVNCVSSNHSSATGVVVEGGHICRFRSFF